MTELLLGLDIGTASSKAVLVTPDGSVVASARRAHAVSMPRSGWVEHDAETVWWDDARALVAELLVERDARTVAAVGVSGIGPCFVACDANDMPLRPAILYGIDTRAGDEIDAIEGLLGADAILARGGSALSSQALGPKLRWLVDHEPHVAGRMRRWHMAHTFVVARLCGAWVLDHHSASQCDPLYDLDACDWAHDWAEAILPGVVLPELAWPGDVVGVVDARAAAATGLAEGTPVIAGTIDAWAEAVSVDVRRPGELMVMYGSTMFLVAPIAARRDGAGLWLTRGVDEGTFTQAAGMATGGSVAAWLREILGAIPYPTLAAEAAASPPGANGLLLLPYFAGERTPIQDPDARGVLAGLTLRHTRGDVYRAALEGVAYGVRHNLDAMGAKPDRAVAVGGGVTELGWTRILSDVCGLAQEVPRETIGASLGDARLAAEGIGLVGRDARWSATAETLVPDARHADVYAERYAAYRAAYPATRDLVHGLAGAQEVVG